MLALLVLSFVLVVGIVVGIVVVGRRRRAAPPARGGSPAPGPLGTGDELQRPPG